MCKDCPKNGLKNRRGFVTFHMCCVHIALICDILWFNIKKIICAHSINVNFQNKQKRTIKNGLLCHNIQSKTFCEICGLLYKPEIFT